MPRAAATQYSRAHSFQLVNATDVFVRSRHAAPGMGRLRYASRVFEVSNERFEELVSEGLQELPDPLRRAIDNVAIIVETESRHRNLFGLYEGIPLTDRDLQGYSGAMPDRITLFQRTICSVCESDDDVRSQVRKTVIHEIAHHFGISDPRLEELGWA
jgi:predicted Zn-dependent protease with MMP-like domain